MQFSSEYAIITPVRNEERFIEKLIQSVVQQKVLPGKWVIINDGSTDNTRQIIYRYAEQYSWIDLINLEDRGKREPGGDRIFHLGLKNIDLDSVKYLARIDGDVSFSPEYFSKMIEIFENHPRLGVASGEMVYVDRGKPEKMMGPEFQTHGPCKFYRVVCLKEIGGLDSRLGWDIIDNIKAIMAGWEAKRIPSLEFIHYRRIGSQRGAFGIFENLGRAAYLTGYHPLFVLAKFAKRLFFYPFLIGSIYMLFSYFRGFFEREPRIISSKEKQFIQSEQLKRLLGRNSVWQ